MSEQAGKQSHQNECGLRNLVFRNIDMRQLTYSYQLISQRQTTEGDAHPKNFLFQYKTENDLIHRCR